MSTKTIKRYILPATSLGNSRTLTVIRYGDNTVGDKAYIQAGLHADEAPGFVVISGDKHLNFPCCEMTQPR